MSIKRLITNLALALMAVVPALLAAAGGAQAQSSVARFRNLSVADGLSQSAVSAIWQDRQGYMWFGTEDGLNKYNGYDFQIYRHDPNRPGSLIDNSINTIYEDLQGNLWVGTPAGLELYNRQTGEFIHYRHDVEDSGSLYGSNVVDLLEDSQGELWVATSDGGLNLLDRGTGRFVRYMNDPRRPASLAHPGVNVLYEDRQGELWVGTDSGLDRFVREGGEFIHYTNQPDNKRSLSDNRVRSIYDDGSGALWVATAGGLNRLDRKSGEFTRFLHDPLDESSLSSDELAVVYKDSNGQVWAGGRGGLDLFAPESGGFIHFRNDPNDSHSLGNDSVFTLYEDIAGTLWVGTFGGLSRYNRNSDKFSLYQHRANDNQSLSDNFVNAIFEDEGGNLWVGTLDGGLNRINRKTGANTVYLYDPEEVNSIGSNEVRAILEDSTSTLWVGTGGGGLNRYDSRSDGFIHYWHDPEDPASISDNTVRVIFEDRLGNLWVGTRSGGLNLLNRATGGFKRFLSDPNSPFSLSNNDVRAITEDRAGRLWVGTYGGIDVLSRGGSAFIHYRHNPSDSTSLANDRVLALHEDRNGFMWVGTLLGGLSRFDPRVGHFIHYTEKDGLSNDTIFGILEDERGFLWLSTNKGISRFDPQSESFRNFDVSDGLQSNEFNQGASFQSASGELFFGGIQGFNTFFPALVTDNVTPPPVVITVFNKNNQAFLRDITTGQEIRLTYQDNFISFEFAALDYNAPEKNLYAYKLEGFNREWIMAGSRRYASYTNLEGGSYTFRVIGSNSDGVWNDVGAAVRLVVVAPFWESWWFTGLATIVVVGGVLAGYRLRIRAIQAQTRQLEEQVAERTHEIERRRVVAEGLRDILAILNSNRSLSESLDYIITQIVRLLGAQHAIIFRCLPDGRLNVVAGNLPASGNGNGSHLRERAIPGWLSQPLLRGEQVLLPDLSLVGASGEGAWLLEEHSSLLGIPMLLNDRVEGGLVLLFRNRRIFTDEELKTAATFADHSALAIANAELRSQAEELAVATERSRLARDLHDAVTQTLFATSLIAEVVPRLWERNPEEGKRKLDEVRELTRGALAEMRTLLMELRPSALVDVPIYDLLQQLSDAFRGRARVPVKLVADRACQLPGEVQVGFYRIAQEALNNTFKHARASMVEVRLSDQNGLVTLYVADNGCGFDPAQIGPDHFGVGIMDERAQAVGADFKLDSMPEKGTRITVTWRRDEAGR